MSGGRRNDELIRFAGGAAPSADAGASSRYLPPAVNRMA
jgi:hypothetical protein